MKQFKFNIDSNSSVKKYRQLFNIFVELIESGEIKEGEKIPSVRVFSNTHNISRNTVTHAYKDLIDAGYLSSQEKSGFYAKLPSSSAPIPVNISTKSIDTDESATTLDDSVPTVESILKERNNNISIKDKEKDEEIENLLLSEKPNTFVTSDPLMSEQNITEELNKISSAPIPAAKRKVPVIFPTGEFLDKNHNQVFSLEKALFESYKKALNENNEKILNDSSPFGDETLKIAIAAFIYKFHKIDANPSQIIVGSNIEQLFYNVLNLPSIKNPHKKTEGLGLLKMAENVNSPEISPCIALPETTDLKYRTLFSSCGFDIKEIPLTEFGMNTDFLSTSGATIAFFSSSNFPEKSDLVLSDPEEYSHELKDWLSIYDYRYIFEFDTSTIPQIENPRLKSLESFNQTVYFCSFKHLISSYVNSGFVVLPKNLINEYKTKYEAIGCQVSKLEQIALTDLILSGKLLNYLENLEAL